MDNNMYKALKATQFTTIDFRLTTYDAALESGDPSQVVVKAQGTLTIAGTAKPVTVELTAKRLPNGTFKLEGSRDLLMTDFNVAPPRLMMGAVKTDNKVVVRFDLLMQEPQVAAARD
jgi:polyisoprenoid-binding protein YceI